MAFMETKGTGPVIGRYVIGSIVSYEDRMFPTLSNRHFFLSTSLALYEQVSEKGHTEPDSALPCTLQSSLQMLKVALSQRNYSTIFTDS